MSDCPVLSAIIFDVDGTLAETEELHRRAFNETFAEYGLDWWWTKPLYRELLKVTGGKERLLHFVRTHRPRLDRSVELDQFVKQLHERKTIRYRELIAGCEIQLRPGVERLINEALGAGVPLAIATTTSRPNVDTLLSATMGLRGIEAFNVICAGDSVPRKKPAPDVYLAALNELDVPAACCIAIEDTKNGFDSASAAGIPVLITKSYYAEEADFGEALAVVDSLDTADPHCLLGPRIDLATLRGLLLDRFRSQKLRARNCEALALP